MSGLDFSVMFSEGGSTHELGTERSLRRAIENGLLTRDTLVTLVRADETRALRAGAVASLAPLFDQVLGAIPNHEQPTALDIQESPERDDIPPNDERESALPSKTILPTITMPSAPPTASAQTDAGSATALSDDSPEKNSDANEGEAGETHRLDTGPSGGIPKPVFLVAIFIALIAAVLVLGRCGSDSTPGPVAVPSEQIVTLYVAREANVRPGADSPEVGTLQRGQLLRGAIRGAGDGDRWLEIAEGQYARHWVWAGNLSPNPRLAVVRNFDGTAYQIRRDGILRREMQDGTFSTVPVQSGDKLKVLALVEGDQYEIRMDGGGVGYVSADLFRSDEVPEPEPEPQVEQAAQERENERQTRVTRQRPAESSRTCQTVSENGLDQTYCRSASGRWVREGAPRPVRPQQNQQGSAAPRVEEPPAPRPTPPTSPRTITDPQWVTRPTPQYPDRAMQRGIDSGRVVLTCSVQPNGRIRDCVIVSEDPVGAGFGREALAAARRAAISPQSVGGAATGARVTFSVSFRMAPEADR